MTAPALETRTLPPTPDGVGQAAAILRRGGLVAMPTETVYGLAAAATDPRALAALYARHGLHTSIVLRGALGFGAAHHLRTDRLLTLSEDLPVVSIAVDAAERVAPVVAEARPSSS